jgi:alpha-D-xyloside xylohydrolase
MKKDLTHVRDIGGFIIIVLSISLLACNKLQNTVRPSYIKEVEIELNKVLLFCDKGLILVSFYSENIVHFAYFPEDKQVNLPSWGILPVAEIVNPKVAEEGNTVTITSSQMAVKINKKDCSMSYSNSDGEPFLKSRSFSLEPVVVSGENTYKLKLSFDAPADENYYGLGQHQNVGLNLKGKVVQGWHSYEGDKGEIIGFPFMVTNKNYAFLLDNPSRVMTYPGQDGITRWTAEVADAISYYVIYGNTSNDIYKGYRALTGTTPLPPKAKLGYMHCKTGRPGVDNQADLLKMATKYRHDENDNYNYEQGYFATFSINWNDKANTLIFSDQEGNYPGVPLTKKINLVMVNENQEMDERPVSRADKLLDYRGKESSIQF